MTSELKWYVTKGDLPSFPWKVTTGEICTDCRTLDDAIETCNRYNKEDI
jgi:hypothetical protein